MSTAWKENYRRNHKSIGKGVHHHSSSIKAATKPRSRASGAMLKSKYNQVYDKTPNYWRKSRSFYNNPGSQQIKRASQIPKISSKIPSSNAFSRTTNLQSRHPGNSGAPQIGRGSKYSPRSSYNLKRLTATKGVSRGSQHLGIHEGVTKTYAHGRESKRFNRLQSTTTTHQKYSFTKRGTRTVDSPKPTPLKSSKKSETSSPSPRDDIQGDLMRDVEDPENQYPLTTLRRPHQSQLNNPSFNTADKAYELDLESSLNPSDRLLNSSLVRDSKIRTYENIKQNLQSPSQRNRRRGASPHPDSAQMLLDKPSRSSKNYTKELIKKHRTKKERLEAIENVGNGRNLAPSLSRKMSNLPPEREFDGIGGTSEIRRAEYGNKPSTDRSPQLKSRRYQATRSHLNELKESGPSEKERESHGENNKDGAQAETGRPRISDNEDITYTNYTGDLLCIRGSTYIKKLQKKLHKNSMNSSDSGNGEIFDESQYFLNTHQSKVGAKNGGYKEAEKERVSVEQRYQPNDEAIEEFNSEKTGPSSQSRSYEESYYDETGCSEVDESPRSDPEQPGGSMIGSTEDPTVPRCEVGQSSQDASRRSLDYQTTEQESPLIEFNKNSQKERYYGVQAGSTLSKNPSRARIGDPQRSFLNGRRTSKEGLESSSKRVLATQDKAGLGRKESEFDKEESKHFRRREETPTPEDVSSRAVSRRDHRLNISCSKSPSQQGYLKDRFSPSYQENHLKRANYKKSLNNNTSNSKSRKYLQNEYYTNTEGGMGSIEVTLHQGTLPHTERVDGFDTHSRRRMLDGPQPLAIHQTLENSPHHLRMGYTQYHGSSLQTGSLGLPNPQDSRTPIKESEYAHHRQRQLNSRPSLKRGPVKYERHKAMLNHTQKPFIDEPIMEVSPGRSSKNTRLDEINQHHVDHGRKPSMAPYELTRKSHRNKQLCALKDDIEELKKPIEELIKHTNQLSGPNNREMGLGYQYPFYGRVRGTEKTPGRPSWKGDQLTTDESFLRERITTTTDMDQPEQTTVSNTVNDLMPGGTIAQTNIIKGSFYTMSSQNFSENLEKNLDKFTMKLHRLEKKLTHIERSRGYRSPNMSRTPLKRVSQKTANSRRTHHSKPPLRDHSETRFMNRRAHQQLDPSYKASDSNTSIEGGLMPTPSSGEHTVLREDPQKHWKTRLMPKSKLPKYENGSIKEGLTRGLKEKGDLMRQDQTHPTYQKVNFHKTMGYEEPEVLKPLPDGEITKTQQTRPGTDRGFRRNKNKNYHRNLKKAEAKEVAPEQYNYPGSDHYSPSRQDFESKISPKMSKSGEVNHHLQQKGSNSKSSRSLASKENIPSRSGKTSRSCSPVNQRLERIEEEDHLSSNTTDRKKSFKENIPPSNQSISKTASHKRNEGSIADPHQSKAKLRSGVPSAQQSVDRSLAERSSQYEVFNRRVNHRLPRTPIQLSKHQDKQSSSKQPLSKVWKSDIKIERFSQKRRKSSSSAYLSSSNQQRTPGELNLEQQEIQRLVGNKGMNDYEKYKQAAKMNSRKRTGKPSDGGSKDIEVGKFAGGAITSQPQRGVTPVKMPPRCPGQGSNNKRGPSQNGGDSKRVSNSINGQVSYMERIAKEQYLRPNIGILTAFQGYLGDCKEQLILARRCQQYLRSRPFRGTKLFLKRNFKKLNTLLIDLDETLVHSEEYKEGNEYDLQIEVENDGTVDRIGVYVRPFCKEFLETLHKQFEIIIFTASRDDYADKVIDALDPDGTMIAHRLYRQHCINFEELYVKDLRLLSNRSKENLVIIDNLIYSYANDLENGIPIKPYYCGKEDYELPFLAEKLEALKSFMDCPQFIREQFKFDKFYEYL